MCWVRESHGGCPKIRSTFWVVPKISILEFILGPLMGNYQILVVRRAGRNAIHGLSLRNI